MWLIRLGGIKIALLIMQYKILKSAPHHSNTVESSSLIIFFSHGCSGLMPSPKLCKSWNQSFSYYISKYTSSAEIPQTERLWIHSEKGVTFVRLTPLVFLQPAWPPASVMFLKTVSIIWRRRKRRVTHYNYSSFCISTLFCAMISDQHNLHDSGKTPPTPWNLLLKIILI